MGFARPRDARRRREEVASPDFQTARRLALRGLAAPLVAMVVVLGACGPLATFRPASGLMEGRTMELGLGAAAVSPRPYVNEPWAHAGQMWLTGQAKSWLHLSGIAAFDPRAMGLGGSARALVLRADRVRGGVDLEAGYGWGAASLPFALRLFDQHWFYASPRISNYGIEPLVGVPIGLNVHLQGGGFLRIEYQSSWARLQAFNQRHHLGAALAVQW
jgi:hypothetical protein